MFDDRYGLPVTTANAEAFGWYADALDRMLAQRDGARARLTQATEADPQFALAWALLGLQLRLDGEMKPGAALVEQSVALADRCTSREQSQLAMLDAYCHGRFAEAQSLADQHLATWPADALVMQHCNYIFNLLSADLDRRRQHDDLAQRVLQHNPDDWYFLGEAAFAAAEVGRYDDAHAYATRSFAANSDNGEAAHGAAHAFHETGELGRGSAWLAQWLASWDAPSGFGGHLAWHLALFAVADGRAGDVDIDESLAYLDRPLTLLMDAGSLFWRLRLAGFDALPWAALVDLPSAPGYSLSNFHRAFVLAALGDFEELDEWAVRLRRNVERGHPSAAVCADVVAAIGLHALGEFAACAQQFERIEADLPRLGGSRAQLEVLDDTLVDALAQSGRAADAVARLDARLARRDVARDRAWRDRLR